MGSEMCIRDRDDLDEAIAWLLQSEAIVEVDEDAFALS